MRQEVIKVYPKAKFHEAGHRIGEDETIAFLKDCDAAIIGFEPITERMLSALPQSQDHRQVRQRLRDHRFRGDEAPRREFGYTWGVNKLAVAELTLGFMLMGLRYVMPLNLAMRAGERPRIRNGLFLTGRIVGIHGCGNIGKEVVRLLQPFNCNDPRLRHQGLFRFLQAVERHAGLVRRAAGALGGPDAAPAEDQQTIGLYSRDGAEASCSPDAS